jgi:hypothetical protein
MVVDGLALGLGGPVETGAGLTEGVGLADAVGVGAVGAGVLGGAVVVAAVVGGVGGAAVAAGVLGGAVVGAAVVGGAGGVVVGGVVVGGVGLGDAWAETSDAVARTPVMARVRAMMVAKEARLSNRRVLGPGDATAMVTNRPTTTLVALANHRGPGERHVNVRSFFVVPLPISVGCEGPHCCEINARWKSRDNRPRRKTADLAAPCSATDMTLSHSL